MIGSWPPTILMFCAKPKKIAAPIAPWIPFTKDHRSHRDKSLTGDRCHGKATRDRLSKQGTAHPPRKPEIKTPE